jgi:hypothetical protein
MRKRMKLISVNCCMLVLLTSQLWAFFVCVKYGEMQYQQCMFLIKNFTRGTKSYD